MTQSFLLKRLWPSSEDEGDFGVAQRRVVIAFCVAPALLALGLLTYFLPSVWADSPTLAVAKYATCFVLLVAPFTPGFHNRPTIVGGVLIAIVLFVISASVFVEGGVLARTALLLSPAVFAAAIVVPPRVSQAYALVAVGVLGSAYIFRDAIPMESVGAVIPAQFLMSEMIMLIAATAISWVLAAIFRQQMMGVIAAREGARDAADKANEAKSEFLSRVSHEFRTPLNGMIGMSELLRATNLTSRQRFYVETALKSGESLARIADDVLEFSKMKVGELRLASEPFELEEVVTSAVALATANASEKGVRVFVRVQPDLPHRLVADGPRLRQVLLHLVSNAVKFTDEGCVSIDVSGTKLLDRRVALTIKISDTGIGIAKDKLGSIFEIFTQGGGVLDRPAQGVGIGLAIVSRLVAAMGGTLSCRSRPGEGSVFAIELVTPGLQEPNPAVARAGGRIAILSDHELGGAILDERLTHLGYQTHLIQLQDGILDVQAAPEEPCGATIIDYSERNLLNAVRVGQIADVVQKIGAPALMLSQVGRRDISVPFDVMAHLSTPMTTPELVDQIAASSAMSVGVTRPGQTVTSRNATRTPGLVLVVGDHDVNFLVLNEHLEQLGLDVARAETGREALRLFRRLGPVIVLMDVAMPGMDGLAATREIRKIEAEGGVRTPIIGVTDHVATSRDAEVCRAAGMDGCLSKPVQRAELINCLSHWIRDEDERALA